jgi:hypothetical protein
MKDWRLAVGKLNEIVEGTSGTLSIGEQAGLYAGARVLLADLEEAVEAVGGNTYALDKIGNVRWHIGAALGFDTDSGHSADDHRTWAYGALKSLNETLEIPPSEAD